jgi:hypothetical protein
LASIESPQEAQWITDLMLKAMDQGAHEQSLASLRLRLIRIESERSGQEAAVERRNHRGTERIMISMVKTGDDTIEGAVIRLIGIGKKRGYLTWEEMNEALPDEAVSPDNLEMILEAGPGSGQARRGD